MKEDKRQHIIKSAMHMFNENGFHNTPTSKIAKAAGVSVGTLFNYFATKEELINSIYLSIKIHTKEYFLADLDESLSDYELTKSMWTSIVKWGIENPDEFKFMGLFTYSPFKNMKKDKNLTEQYAKIKDRFVKVFKGTAICTKNPEFSMIYMNSVVRATTQYLVEHDIQDEINFIHSAFDLFWYGYAKK